MVSSKWGLWGGVFALLASLNVQASGGEVEQRSEEALAVTQSFMQQLGKTMMRTMKQEGPVAAIKVCAEQAPQMTAQISRQRGWKVTRIGTRVRNPMLGMGDTWEQRVLARFQQRLAEGDALNTMVFAEIVTEPDGRYFRFAKAIGVKPKCLVCHGSKKDMPEAVQQLLQARYPFDQATGYRPGELRGAVSIKQPLHSM